MAPDRSRQGQSGRNGRESLTRLRRSARHKCEAMGKMSPARVGGKGHVGQRLPGLLFEPLRPPSRQRLQGRFALRRQRDEMEGPIEIERGRLRRHRRGLFQDQMDIRSAEAERADPRDPPPAGRPRSALGRDRHRQLRPRDVGAGDSEVEVGRNLSVVQGQHHLHEPRDAGGRFEMAHVRLDRAHEQGAVRAPARAEHRAQRLHLDGIAERGAGAVSLDVGHLLRGHSGEGQGLAQERLLGGAVGRGEAAAGPVLVDGPAADHG